ncbi:MAG: hypothetical protein JKY88_15400 [Pseudomonadales bacterium]|nr:hypothetical protein [Pseudomonadales bacterium]
MNSKVYVGTFPEIAGLDNLEQETQLERARYEAFTVQGLSGKFALHMVISFMIGFVIAMTLSYFADFSIMASALSVGVGVLLSSFYMWKLNARLLRQGLTVFLTEEKKC